MKVFLAGATGVIGRRMVRLLRDGGITVVGTTRTPAKGRALSTLGATPVVVDMFDAEAVARAIDAAEPDVVVHQLTDLPSAPGTPGYAEALARNARLRIDGTRNLMAAAAAAGVGRVVAQSIAFIYAPAPGKLPGLRVESDPLDDSSDPSRAITIDGVRALERAVLETSGIDGLVLRYGFLYGPGTWSDMSPKPPAIHVDAAAQAAVQAVRRGAPGLYNIAEDDGVVSSEKAKRAFGFDAAFRLMP